MNAGGTSLSFGSYSCGERMMPGQFRKPNSNKTGGVEIAFLTESAKLAFDKAVQAGAKVVTPPTEMPWGQMVAYLRAPEGTVVGLCSPKVTP